MQAGIVIVGSGLGGFGLARELRKRDSSVKITIVTGDDGASYSKPMLSVAFAQGKDPETLVLKPAERMAAELDATILAHHRVTAIHREDRALAVTTQDGGAITLAYDKLVLALGADPRPFRAAGDGASHLHSVNDLADYRHWRQSLKREDRVLLIGAGLIGCEFANDLAGAGYKVTLVDPAPWPLSRLLPQAMGELLAESLTAAGILLHTGRQIALLNRNHAELDDGSKIEFERVLSAIGLAPRIDLAAAAGLRTDKGIVVDEHLATSDPAIFALGDCAQTAAGLLPFVLPLMAQSRALAASLTGEATKISLPALPVTVKTPCLPMVVCPPLPGVAGQWRIEGEGRDRKALFESADGAPLGFALSGASTRESQALAKIMPMTLQPKAA